MSQGVVIPTLQKKRPMHRQMRPLAKVMRLIIQQSLSLSPSILTTECCVYFDTVKNKKTPQCSQEE